MIFRQVMGHWTWRSQLLGLFRLDGYKHHLLWNRWAKFLDIVQVWCPGSALLVLYKWIRLDDFSPSYGTPFTDHYPWIPNPVGPGPPPFSGAALFPRFIRCESFPPFQNRVRPLPIFRRWNPPFRKWAPLKFWSFFTSVPCFGSLFWLQW